jgi:hypothetical protein
MIEESLAQIDDLYVLFRHLDSIIQLDRELVMKAGL